MVYGAIAQGIYQGARIAIRAIGKYNKYERKLFNFAYRGYPNRVRRGVIHGHVAGQVAGFLINEDDGINDDDGQNGNQVFTPSKYNKTRNRQSRQFSNYCKPRKRRRFAYPRY